MGRDFGTGNGTLEHQGEWYFVPDKKVENLDPTGVLNETGYLIQPLLLYDQASNPEFS